MRQQTLDILIVIPAYNEEKTIGSVIEQVKQTPYNFVVVNDGSTDKTWSEIWKKTNINQRISYPNNRGKGYAIKMGARWARLHKYSYILVLDADSQNSIADIERFDRCLQRHPRAKIIVGNRLANPKNMPFIRYLINKAMTNLINWLGNIKVADSQCGMRLIDLDVFLLALQSNRFEMESEMFIKTGVMSWKIVNIPIKCIYHKGRESKIRPVSDFIRFVKMLLRLRRELA